MSGFYTVALFSMSLAYGGPEEGGWWYEIGEIAEYPVKTFVSKREAMAFRANAQEMANAFLNDHGPEGFRSVCGYETHHAHLYEGHAPKRFPDHRPHYE